MKPNFKKFAYSLLSLGFALGGTSGLFAQEKSPLEFASRVKMEKVVKANDGTQTKQMVDVKTALPGEEVVFVNTFKNNGGQSATNISLVNPVPENMVLKSAFGDKAQITYSLDGKTYDAPEKLSVKLADGKTRAARIEDFTHVRWVVAASLPPGQIGEVGFRAQLK